MPDNPALPEWFIDAFARALARLGWRLVRWQDKAAIVADGNSDETFYGLENIFRMAVKLPEEQRVDRIIQHLGQLKTACHPNVLPNSLNAVRERLFPRLRTPLEDKELAGELWSMPFQDTGLIGILVVDNPQSVTYVTSDLVAESGRSGEEWFRLAVDNLRLITSADLIVEVDDRGLLGVGTADTFDAARGLLLEEFVPECDPRGYIASIPNRDRLYFYPVGDDPFDNRFARLLIQTLTDHQEGAYAICDNVFWIHKGKWLEVGWEWEDEELSVDPPEELKGMLGRDEE